MRNTFKVNNKDTRTTPGVVLVSLMLTVNIFNTLCVSIVNFEQVNVGWAVFKPAMLCHDTVNCLDLCVLSPKLLSLISNINNARNRGDKNGSPC